MKNNIPNITYVSYDAREGGPEKREELMGLVSELKTYEGLQLICKSENSYITMFMEQQGYSYVVDKVSDVESSVYYYPSVMDKDLEMKKFLKLDDDKLRKIMDIKLDVFNGKLNVAEAKKMINETFDVVTADEFAYGEQHLLSFGIDDEIIADGMDDILDVFEDVLERSDLNLPLGHPIRTYELECKALDTVVGEMKLKLDSKFIKNEWLVLYDKLSEINTHFSRKQNQLFSALERKGFDRPSKVMWTFDNKVRDAIKDARLLLEADNDSVFLKAQENVMFLVLDILSKEKSILYPTSIKLIPEEEFAEMRISDDEIGYCLINNPVAWPKGQSKLKKEEKSVFMPKAATGGNELMKDLSLLLAKHGIAQSAQEDEVFDVSMGKLSLKQINMIFRHLQVDLSYVDENEIVKFYSDTVHRVFPRSAGVIGREVQNCHPRESVATVERIIEAFRTGEKKEAEFWIQMGGKFIYIIYNAVHDEDGVFRGVLEMMQDVTHIRSLEGNQKLLSWDDEPNEKSEEKSTDKLDVKLDVEKIKRDNKHGLNKKTILGDLFKEHLYLKDYLFTLSPKFKNLKNPIVFNVMKTVATLEMVSERGGLDLDDLISNLSAEIDKHS